MTQEGTVRGLFPLPAQLQQPWRVGWRTARRVHREEDHRAERSRQLVAQGHGFKRRVGEQLRQPALGVLARAREAVGHANERKAGARECTVRRSPVRHEQAAPWAQYMLHLAKCRQPLVRPEMVEEQTAEDEIEGGRLEQ